MSVKQIGILGFVLALASCGGSTQPLPNCPTPTPGQESNSGGLYYSHQYEFHNAEACFKASFPAPPRITQQDVHTAFGTIVSRTFSAATNVDFFFVSFIHLPWLMATFGGNETILHKVKDQFLAGERAKALKVSPATVGGHKAILIDFERKSGDLGKAHIFVVGHRVYIVNGQSTQKDNPGAAEFLKSFVLDNECLKNL
jgi:hypothetical protein